MKPIRHIYAAIAVSLAFSNTAFAQNVIQLIGFESDDSAFSTASYAVMYDNTDDPVYDKAYTPYHTIGVARHGDDVKLLKQDYLIVPTAEGFRYVTQNVEEVKNDPGNRDTDDEYAEEFMQNYAYLSSVTQPRFFRSRDEIRRFIVSQRPTFADAIRIQYQRISFVTPDFYITQGFESEVHGGATWFNATESILFHAINPALKDVTNSLADHVSRQRLNTIIKDAIADTSYGEEMDENEPIDEDFGMPWAGRLGDYEEVFYTLRYHRNRIWIEPATLINGNSVRSFLVAGKSFEDEAILRKLNVKQPSVTTDHGLEFVSPDGSTRITIADNILTVRNATDNKLLLQRDIEPFHKLVMSEWALGKYVDRWQSQF